MKSSKGITLVALVITIIVLLILAGVSISLVVGDNGVLTNAQNSSNASKIGQMKEAMGLAVSSCQANYFNAYASNASADYLVYIDGDTLESALSLQGYHLNKDNNSTTSDTAADGDFDESTLENVYYISDKAGVTSGDRLYVKVKVESGTKVTVTFGNDLAGSAPSAS